MTATSENDRTETKRFTNSVSGDDLIEGDRISKDLVARVPGQLGERVRPAAPEADEKPPQTQLVAVTQIDRYDDVHQAILVDTDTETFIRASRHGSNQAWTQKEADWTVHAVGADITVTDAEIDELGSADEPEDVTEYVQGWIDVLFSDMAAGHFDYNEERSLSGSTLELYEPYDSLRVYATVTLENND